MTEPIRAAEVLAEHLPPSDESWDAEAAGVGLVADLLALFPEGDVVIRRDGTVAGLRQAYCICSAAPAGKPDHPKAHHSLVPLSREAE